VGTLLRAQASVVLVAAAIAGVLIVLWTWLGAGFGGDLAAQYAWMRFAHGNPNSAYDLAWYGGMHPASYSPLSPYVMAVAGVRTTTVVSGALSAALLALLLVRSPSLRHTWWPAIYGSLALTANAVSGRTTFSLGTMFGLAAVTVLVAGTRTPRSRARAAGRTALAVVLSAMATAASPVAGLFVGIVAGALWLSGRRADSLALGVPPVLVVVASAWLFPFSGRQPMHPASLILPLVIAVVLIVLSPNEWRTLRVGSALYAVAVIASCAVPSPIGSNIVRLGLVFGGVPLVALAANRAAVRPDLARLVPPHPTLRTAFRTTLLAGAIGLSSVWQVSVATSDAIASRPDRQAAWPVDELVRQLQARGAAAGRTEAVPRKNHQEAATLSTYVNLARGWNRQADAERNPIFYDDTALTAAAYREWLATWAVRFVVVAADRPDPAAEQEWALVRSGLSYLHPVWSDRYWTLYEVDDAVPLADPPSRVEHFDSAGLTLRVPRAGSVLVRIRYSPWLRLVDADGKRIPGGDQGCLTAQPTATPDGSATQPWVVLHAPRPGTYRIEAPYALPRGSACPQE